MDRQSRRAELDRLASVLPPEAVGELKHALKASNSLMLEAAELAETEGMEAALRDRVARNKDVLARVEGVEYGR